MIKDISCVKDINGVSYNGTNFGCIQVKVHKGRVLSINPISGNRIISTSSDGGISILDNSLKVINTLEGHKNEVWKAIEIGDKIYSISADNSLKIWKKSDENYIIEESIEIQGNPRDIKKINEDLVFISTQKNQYPTLINLKTKEQKPLDKFNISKSLDESVFFINNRIVFVEANSFKLIDPKTMEMIFSLDNQEKIWKVKCKGDMLYTIQYNFNNNDSQIKELGVFQVENDKITKISGNNYNKTMFDLLDIGIKNKDFNELKNEIKNYEEKKSYKVINQNNYNLITNDEDFKFFALNINNNAKISYELLYKASVDGEASTVFHSKCDGKGETITVVKIVKGSKCGGFTPISWQKDGCWQKDPSLRSFVCNLDNQQKFNLKKNYSHALDFHEGKLSCFGGYTLQLTDKNISNKNGICQATDYEIQSPNDLIGINEQSFQVEDIEVFLVRQE